MKVQDYSMLALYLLSFFACGQSQNSNLPSDRSKAEQKIDKTNQSGAYFKLKKHEVYDREGTGLVAISTLIPENWTVRDQLYWDYNDATLPIRYKGLYQSSDKNMSIEFFSDVRSAYSEGPMGVSGYPPPNDVVSGLQELIRQNRSGKQYSVVNTKIINKSGPENQYVQGTYFQTYIQAGLVRIAFMENNVAMEEEFYGRLVLNYSSSQGVVTLSSIFWSLDGLYSSKAPKGQMTKCTQIAQCLKSSSKLTLAFYNKFMQVVQLLSDQFYREIYAVGQISRIISQTNDQISKSISDSYWQTQKSYERTNRQFSDYLRGVDQYNDGGQNVQLPSGYSNAWVNDRGEYLLGESPSFDPNQQGIGNWRELERR